MLTGDALAGWLRLTLLPGLGGESQRKLLAAFGLPEAIFSAGRRAVAELIGERKAALLFDTENANAVAEAGRWADGASQHIVTLADDEYPRSLLEIPDPPSLLYVRGDLGALNTPTLAVVGSRQPTAQGLRNAEAFAAALAEAGWTVASGMALGVDAAAHRGALGVGGRTVALIGTGIDRVYPARNRALALEIGERGTIVSEFPLGTPVAAANFPRRNRLISGLSRGVLVVEAGTESGSLITARLATEQGREVFAIPGSIHSPQSRGCHRLIKQGAKLVETASDILEELDWAPLTPRADTAKSEVDDKAAALVLDCLGFDPCLLDELVARSQLSAEAIAAPLLQLELTGRIACLPGGLYQRVG